MSASVRPGAGARALAGLVVVLAGGCYHHEVKVPGVLDLRTDARDAPPRDEPLADPYLSRSGFDALLEGDGVTPLGTGVVVEDRAYFLFRVIPIYNDSATEELAAALGADGALRDVRLTEGFSIFDSALAVVGPSVPLLGLPLAVVLPPMTVGMRGVRVHAARATTAGVPAPTAPVTADDAAPLPFDDAAPSPPPPPSTDDPAAADATTTEAAP